MKRRFFAWPGWAFLRFAWLLSAANAVWFAFVYGGSHWLTARRSLRVPIHLEIELSIPLIPGAVVAYMSIYLLFLAAPFVVRERRALRRSSALSHWRHSWAVPASCSCPHAPRLRLRATLGFGPACSISQTP